jgi:hypothetical protein
VQIQFQCSQYSVAFCEKEKISKNLQKGPMVTKGKKTENKMEFKKNGKKGISFQPYCCTSQGARDQTAGDQRAAAVVPDV